MCWTELESDFVPSVSNNREDEEGVAPCSELEKQQKNSISLAALELTGVAAGIGDGLCNGMDVEADVTRRQDLAVDELITAVAVAWIFGAELSLLGSTTVQEAHYSCSQYYAP